MKFKRGHNEGELRCVAPASITNFSGIFQLSAMYSSQTFLADKFLQ